MLKHPRFRVADILTLTPEVRAELLGVIKRAADATGLPYVDAEIVGSFALGCASIHSDVDTNLAFRTFEETQKYRAQWGTVGRPAIDILDGFQRESGLKIQMIPSNHDSKQYNVVYSVKADRLYGRDDGQPIFKHLSWNTAAKRWEFIPFGHRSFNIAFDPWEDEAPKWRQVYGDRFLELRRKHFVFPPDHNNPQGRDFWALTES